MFEKLNCMKKVVSSNPFHSSVFMLMDFGFRYIKDDMLNSYIFKLFLNKTNWLSIIN